MLAGLFVLTGCGDSKKTSETPPSVVTPPPMVITTAAPTATPEVSSKPVAVDCPYSSLGFEGRDVNAQHYPKQYSTSDAKLISEIWNILSGNEREEVSDYQSYEDMMCLTFLGQNKTERVNLQPDDYCELIDSGKKYSLAPGSYSTISALLTDYTTKNCSFVIDENFLSIMTDAVEPLVFMLNTPHITVMPSVTGDFTENWVLIPTDIMNWEHTGRFAYIQNIYTNEGFGPVEISVHFDELLIGVSCDGVSKLFSTDQGTMDSIERLFASIENG